MSKLNRRNGATGGTGRWSAKCKAEAVLRLVKGEDLDTLSRQLKVTATTLRVWVQRLKWRSRSAIPGGLGG